MSHEDKHPVEMIADATGGTIKEMGSLPDGSGFAILSIPLRTDHWIYAESQRPPMPFRMGNTNPRRNEWAEKIREAGKYAVRSATMNGKEMDFDPDALIQNLVVGMLGYWTDDALSGDDWANPDPAPPEFKC